MPEQQSYPDIPAKGKAKQEPPKEKAAGGPPGPPDAERYVAAAEAVKVTADLWSDVGRGESEMKRRIIEALRGVKP